LPLYHSIDLQICDHSIASCSRIYSINSTIMPPITRSMTKRNIYSDLDFQSAEKPIACDVSTMPDSPLSSLLLDRGPGHSINSEFQNLEFSKFGIFKISNFVHNLNAICYVGVS
jgi:hypothetical protein